LTTSPPWEDLEVGLKVGPLRYMVTPAMVRSYCDALPAESASYLSPGDGCVAAMPPTMFATSYVALLREHLHLGHGLMARHSLRTMKPVQIGTTIEIRGEITEKYERKGRHYWTLRYEVADESGTVCCLNEVTCSVD